MGILVACMQGTLLCSLVRSVHKPSCNTSAEDKTNSSWRAGTCGFYSSSLTHSVSPEGRAQLGLCSEVEAAAWPIRNSCEVNPRSSSSLLLLLLPTLCAVADDRVSLFPASAKPSLLHSFPSTCRTQALSVITITESLIYISRTWHVPFAQDPSRNITRHYCLHHIRK
jgi:hypothetical protein